MSTALPGGVRGFPQDWIAYRFSEKMVEAFERGAQAVRERADQAVQN